MAISDSNKVFAKSSDKTRCIEFHHEGLKRMNRNRNRKYIYLNGFLLLLKRINSLCISFYESKNLLNILFFSF